MVQNNRILQKVTDAQFAAVLAGFTKATSWPQGLQKFIAKNPTVKLPSKPSDRNISHQIIALFAANVGLAFDRSHLTAIGEKLGRTSGDSIQWANKIERVGIKLDKTPEKSPAYGFAALTFSDKYLHSAQDLTTDAGRDASVSRSRRLFESMSKGKFERGHKDPRKPLTDDNLVMQPYEINRSYRDRYIFDDNGLPTVPNPIKFVLDPSSYYEDEADLRMIYDALKLRFEPQTPAVADDSAADSAEADEG